MGDFNSTSGFNKSSSFRFIGTAVGFSSPKGNSEVDENFDVRRTPGKNFAQQSNHPHSHLTTPI